MNTSRNFLSSIYVINLDSREDRWDECVQEINRVGIDSANVQRFSAIPNSIHGIIGCAFSHASAMLQFLIRSNEPYCLILEDDFKFVESLDNVIIGTNQFLEEKSDWNVLLFAANKNNLLSMTTQSEYYLQVFSAQTASAYLIKRDYITHLIHRILLGADKLKKYIPMVQPTSWGPLLNLYANDAIWKDLQKEGGWYVLNPIPIVQRASYSDIQKEFVDYGT